MHPKKRAVSPSDWRAIASLGEQLVSAQSLKAQHDRIIGLTALVRETPTCGCTRTCFGSRIAKNQGVSRRPAAARCRKRFRDARSTCATQRRSKKCVAAIR
jgi:hypothetical protein